MPDVDSVSPTVGEHMKKKTGENSASFLRAARAGNVTELVELLKAGTDINTCNANGLNALHIASKEGHADVVEELLTRGARVDAATKKGNTALHIASLAGQMEVVELLISHGANPNVQSQDGFTPLYMAAQENHDGVVVYLLQHGANQSLATEEGFTPLAVALQQGHDRVVAILLENDTRGKVRLPALHIAAKKDDTKAAALLLQSDHNPDVTSKSGFTPLHIAAHYGNENIARMLLEKGANVNFMARHNITPLHVASKWGRSNLVALLLAHGAVIDCRTRDLLTPLHCAARSGHDQIVDLLLEKGAPISAKSKNGLAPLHTAAQGDHVDTARILLYHRAPVDEVTVDYLTPLHIAAHYGHVQTAKLLLDRNADPNSRALNGFTPLHVACKKNRIKVVELLLKYQAALEATTESGLTPLHVAAFMGCMNIVVYLMQHGANPDVVTIRGETPLHLATRAYQTDVVRILLRNGATVDATAREGQTPLHIASRLGNADIVMLLLQHGAKVDAPTRDQYTPLHTAAKEGQEEVVALLLDHGASHELQTSKGFKPIHLAAKYGNYPVVEALLEKGADVDAQGKNQVTPLHVAAHYNHEKVALLLLEHKASPRAAAKNGYTPLHIVAKKNQMDIALVLLEYQADVGAESKAGFTPLHLAAQEGHVGMVLFLLEHGAEVNAQARNGLTPMHLCAQDDRVEVAQVLKDHGANLSPRTKAGYTPLHVACHFGQINMVKFLLENGADLNAATSLGYTPLHQAAQQGHGIIVKLLLDEGASPNILTSNGQTPLSIAQKLGYVSVVETLRTITETTVTTETTTVTEERYKVQSPETMQETFISESEDEGDDAYARSLERDLDGLSSLRPFSDFSDVYLNGTSQFMDTSGFGSLRRHSPSSRSSDFYSSLPRRQHHHRPGDGIGKLRYAEEGGVAGSLSFEKEMHQPMDALQDESLLPMDKSLEAEQLQLENLIRKVQEQPFTPSGSDYRLEDAFSPDNVDASRLALHSGFLVSFLVDARGGAMRGCRHSGVRIIVPPRKAPMPMRITCRYLRREKLIHPPPLNEGEALASRILEMGPAGAKFLGPVIIEVPHFASLRGREREIVLMRSEDGEHWKEHALEATEDAVQEVLNESFNPEELSQIEDLNTTRITRILTNDFPQYFALVTRIRQEVHAVGPEGGMIASTVVPQVQALFPEGALTKTIKVSLQAQAIPQDLVNKLHGNRVAVSPIVTVEPRRRKFHKPITLCIPLPQSTNKGMITQYSAQTGQDPPTLRLLCSIVGGTAPAQWEDITGTTQLTFSNDNVSFTTTVSARFWLMDCQTPRESARMAQEIYNDGIVVPYMAKFVVFARRLHPTEGQLRLFCVTDDKEDKTLERQEHYQEIAKSRDVEVLSGRPQYLEFVGNLVPVTKSGEQLSMHFFPFQENRLMFYLKLRDVDDPNAAAAGRVAVMRESRQRSENLPPQHPICTLAITLPNYSGTPPSDVRLTEGRGEISGTEKPTVYESSLESRRAYTPNYVTYQRTPKVPPVESAYFAPSPQAVAQEVPPVRPERRVSNIAPAKAEAEVSQEYVLSKTPDNLEDAEPYIVESPVIERKGAEIAEERTASPIITEPASSDEGYPLEHQRESLESSLASSEQSSDTVVASPRDKGARLASVPSKAAQLSYKEGSASETSTLSVRAPAAPDEVSSEWTAGQLSPFMQSLAYEESNLADAQEDEAAAGRVDLQVNLRRSADSAVMAGTIPDAALVTRGVAEVRRMRGEKFPSYEAPSSELKYDQADDKWATRNYGAEEASTALGDDWRLPKGSEKEVTLNVRLRKGEDQFNSVAIIPEGSHVAPTPTGVHRRTGEVNELRLEELEASKVPLERRLVEAAGDEGKGAKTSQETETLEEGFIEGDGRVVSTKKITRVITTTRTMTTGKDGPKVEETRVTTQQVMDGSERPVVVEEIVSTPEEEMGESRWHHRDTHEGPKEPPGVKYPEEAAPEHDERLSYEREKAALAGTPYSPGDQEQFVLSRVAPDVGFSFEDSSEQRKQESKGVEHLISPSERDTAVEEPVSTFGTTSETGGTSGEATRVSPDNSLSTDYHTPKQTSPTETDSLQGYSVASESDAERMVEMHGYDDWLGEPAGPFLLSEEVQGEAFEGLLRSDLPDSERHLAEDSFSSVQAKHDDSVSKLTSLYERAKGEEKVDEDGSQEDVIAKQKLEYVVERYPAVEVEHVLRYEELEEERFRLVHSGSESFGSDVAVPEMVVADQSSSDAALSSDDVTEVMSTSQSGDSQIPLALDMTCPVKRSDDSTVHSLTYEELTSESFYTVAHEASEQQESLKHEILCPHEEGRFPLREELESGGRSQTEPTITAATSRDLKEAVHVPSASAAELAPSAGPYEPLSERAYPAGTLKYEELEAESFRPDDAWYAGTVSGPSTSIDSEWIRKPSMPAAYEVSSTIGKSEMWIHEGPVSFDGFLSAVPREAEGASERVVDESTRATELFPEEMPHEAVLASDQFSRLSPDSLQEEKTSIAAEPRIIAPVTAEELQSASSAADRDSPRPMSFSRSSQQVSEPKETSDGGAAAQLSEGRAASEETDADWVMVSMMEAAPFPSLQEPTVSLGLQESAEGQQQETKERRASDNTLSLSADSLDGAEPTDESPVSEIAASVRSAEAALEITSEEENNSPRRRLIRPRIRSKQASPDNVSDTASLLEFERLEREITLRGGGDSLSGSEAELAATQAKRRCSNGSQSSLAEFERLERELDESVTAGREERAHGQNGDTADVMLLSDIKEESETEELSSVSGRQTAASFDQRSLSFGDQEESLQKLDSGMTTPEYAPERGYQVERIEDQVEPCMVTSIDSLEGELPGEPQTEASSAQMPTISLVSSDSLEGCRERTDAVGSTVPEASCVAGGMKFIGDFALSDRDSLIASSTSEMSADDGQEAGAAEKSELVSSDTMASFQEYGDEGERDSLCGDYRTADEETLSTPVDETRLPFSVGVVRSSSPHVTSSGGIGAGGDFATTITRFETHRALDDGCMEVITRTVSTRVTDPVSTRIRFTGADSAAQSVQSISARPPTYEEFTSTDEMGNVTTTVVRRISAAEVSGLHGVDGSVGAFSTSETGSLGGGGRGQARTSQGDVSIERRQYRRSYGDIRPSRNHLSDSDNQPARRPSQLRQGDRRSRRRSNGVERKSPDSDGSSDSLDAFGSNA